MTVATESPVSSVAVTPEPAAVAGIVPNSGSTDPVPFTGSAESILDWSIWFCLQLAHRVAIVAFLLLIGVWFLMFKAAGYEKLLAACAGCADLAIVSAGVAMILSRNRPVSRSEGRELVIFNGVLFSIVIYTMLFSRLTYIRIRLQPLTNAPPQTEMPK